MRLLLISSSFTYGKGFLDHCVNEIQDFIQGETNILFIPYALHDYDKYSLTVKTRFAHFGCNVNSIHITSNPIKALDEARIIFIGGGNTFRLLKTLYDKELIDPLKYRIVNQTPFIGSSAGSVIAGPSIKTTNDMPIVYPPSLNALKLIPFHINPHFFELDPNVKIMIESREDRIKQFHEENDSDVLGLREDSFIRIEDTAVTLKGISGAKYFKKGKHPEEFFPEIQLDFLIKN